jgi:hypothetical protein
LGADRDVEHGGGDDGAVAPEPGVGDGGAEERQHGRGARPRVHRRGRRRRGLAERAGQVADQVRRDAVVREPLRHLYPCTHLPGSERIESRSGSSAGDGELHRGGQWLTNYEEGGFPAARGRRAAAVEERVRGGGAGIRRHGWLATEVGVLAECEGAHRTSLSLSGGVGASGLWSLDGRVAVARGLFRNRGTDRLRESARVGRWAGGSWFLRLYS